MAPRGRSLRWLAVAMLAVLSPLTAITVPQVAAQDPVELSMWLDVTDGPDTADCIERVAVESYNALGNGSTVKVTQQANSWDATKTALAGGAGPDLVGTPGPSFAMQLALAGQLAPLDDAAAEFGWDAIFAPNSLNLGRVDGKLYAIPSEIETLVLYYNKTLFEENGWTPPTTIDEMMTLSQTIADAGIIPFAHVNAEWRPANEWFVGEFLNHGAGPEMVYKALIGEVPWTDPAFVAPMETLATMQKNGWFSGGLDRYYTGTFAEAGAMFGEGEAAMKIEGTWFISGAGDFFGEEAGNANELGWVPTPSTDGTVSYTLGIGQTYSVNANSEHPKEAAQFLGYYFSPAIQAALLSECGLANAPVDLSKEDLSGVDPMLAEINASLNEAYAANNYGYTTWTFWPPESETYLIEEVEKVWAGDVTVEDYLAGHQAKFDAEREAGAAPPVPAR